MSVAQLYKVEYRRYGVQAPARMADEIDRVARERAPMSASQVIVEYLQRGMFGSGIYSAEEVAQWRRDELAMLRASRLALDALHGPESERPARLQELARFVIESGMRRAPEYQQAEKAPLLAAEPPAKTPSHAPPGKAERHSGAGPAHRVPRSA